MTIPPLLIAAAGCKPKLRSAKIIHPKELALHMLVAKMLRKHCLPTWRHTHFPGGELLPPYVGAKLKRMGKMPHWPDFILIKQSTRLIHFLELKRLGEDLDEGQEEFRDWCLAGNIPHCVAWTLDDVCMIFDEWDCLRIKFRPD
jgi:hypothetical protein